MKRLKKTLAGLLLLIALFMLYAFYITRNAVNMTTKQKILKAAYPVVMWLSNLSKANAEILENSTAQPSGPFYSLQVTSINGNPYDLALLKGKKVLIVNTASDCGYTGQFEELEKLYQQYQGQLEIIAFPANDFKEQEKGSNDEIAAYCKKNYGVSFPVMSKSIVIVSPEQQAVFKWLTTPSVNGWNSKAPSWNFSKYLINERGQLTHYFGTAVSPLSKEVKAAVAKN